MRTVTANTPQLGAARVKREMPEMLKGSVIVDADQAKIAEDAEARHGARAGARRHPRAELCWHRRRGHMRFIRGSEEAWTRSFSDWRRILPNVWAIGRGRRLRWKTSKTCGTTSTKHLCIAVVNQGVLMPFVRITLSADHPESVRAAVAEGVQNALVSAIGVPQDDRFQVVDAQPATAMHADRHFLDGDRRDLVVVEISLVRGRTEAMKRALYQAIAANLAEVGVRPEDVLVMLHEARPEDFSFGGGQMQLLDEALVRKYGWIPPEA